MANNISYKDLWLQIHEEFQNLEINKISLLIFGSTCDIENAVFIITKGRRNIDNSPREENKR